MNQSINKVPAETRWEIATKGLTGACSAYGNALKEAGGEEKYNEFIRALWYEAGKGAKEFADNLGLTTERAGDIDEVIHLLATTSMGPEFKFEVVEATEDRCVGRATGCPYNTTTKQRPFALIAASILLVSEHINQIQNTWQKWIGS